MAAPLAPVPFQFVNNPTPTSTALVLADDSVAHNHGEALFRDQQLQELTLTLLAVFDPERGAARVIEYVRSAFNLSSLSIVTANLMMGGNGLREPVVHALLQAATGNPSIQNLRLNCCRYEAPGLVALLTQSSVRHLTLLNCQLLVDNRAVGANSPTALLEALRQNRGLETLHVRRSFEQQQLDGEILESLIDHPALTDFGYSVRTPRIAFRYRRLVESFDRTMKFSLLGASLNRESVVAITEGFAERKFNFSVDLKGCEWGPEAEAEDNRDVFIKKLLPSPYLTHLLIDEYSGFGDNETRKELNEIVELHHCLATITGRVHGQAQGQGLHVAPTPGSLSDLFDSNLWENAGDDAKVKAVFLAMQCSDLVQPLVLNGRLSDAP